MNQKQKSFPFLSILVGTSTYCQNLNAIILFLNITFILTIKFKRNNIAQTFK